MANVALDVRCCLFVMVIENHAADVPAILSTAESANDVALGTGGDEDAEVARKIPRTLREMLEQQVARASVGWTTFIECVNYDNHRSHQRDAPQRFHDQPVPLYSDVLRISEVSLLSKDFGKGISEGWVPVREIMCDGAEHTLGMTIPLERAIETEETAKTTELSKVSCYGMGYRRLARPSAAEEEAYARSIGIVDPRDELVQCLLTRALETSLARLEPGASDVSQTLQVDGRVLTT